MADKDLTVMTREEKMQLVQRFQCSPMISHQQETRILSTTLGTGTEMTPEMLDVELNGIPPPTLAKLKRELGMAGEDVATMTLHEKTWLVQLFRGEEMRPRGYITGTPLGPPQVLSTGGAHHVQPVYYPYPFDGLSPPSLATPTPALHTYDASESSGSGVAGPSAAPIPGARLPNSNLTTTPRPPGTTRSPSAFNFDTFGSIPGPSSEVPLTRLGPPAPVPSDAARAFRREEDAWFNARLDNANRF